MLVGCLRGHLAMVEALNCAEVGHLGGTSGTFKEASAKKSETTTEQKAGSSGTYELIGHVRAQTSS